MKHIFSVLCLIMLVLLTSCKSTAPYNQVEFDSATFYLDDLYPQYINYEIESEEDIFSLDQSMIDMVKAYLIPEKKVEQKALNLIDYIFNIEKLNIDYESNANLTAKQTFHSAKANCMSLTIMAYALASYANMNVNFQNGRL